MDLKHAFNDFVNQYVIEAEPEAAQAKQVDPNALMYKAPANAPFTSPVTYGLSSPAQTQQVATSIVAGQFLSTLREKIKTGPQYAVMDQFLSTADALAEFIPDEAQRFRAAAKQLSKTGITPDSVVAAHNEMLQLLSAEAAKFAQLVQVQTATEVTQRAADVDGINTHIEQLKQQITTLTSQRDTIASDIVAHKQKIDAAQAGFDGAVAVIRKEADDFIQKLNTYTSPTK